MMLPVEEIDLEGMQAAALQATGLLKVLANQDRLLLLCQMTQGEYCVADLEELTGVKQPTLSQQLAILRQEELVNTRREGKQIFYSIASEEAMAMMQMLYELYCGPHKSGKEGRK
ncbi:metalloregulator ArsR/SmtB family transcription factor [Oxalobacteraceae bacterium R-40]|uniref:Metalloregulator ArsR/SmtB family transcription factor n=1 Tax=Keguizhuia sedimenti TaxID=3064264 RepID=A0ABU1BTU0_9BURK|nr:metalloregulator ArsR/SmtB family transcription factor [Oxalobacteraceae bacterium R-40]